LGSRSSYERVEDRRGTRSSASGPLSELRCDYILLDRQESPCSDAAHLTGRGWTLADHGNTGKPSWCATAGGWVDLVYRNARSRQQPWTTEFEFHISPVPLSSRSQINEGTEAARARSWCAWGGSSLTSCGLSMASLASAITPSPQRRTSQRKGLNRAIRRPKTGPSSTTPRGPASQGGAGGQREPRPFSVDHPRQRVQRRPQPIRRRWLERGAPMGRPSDCTSLSLSPRGLPEP